MHSCCYRSVCISATRRHKSPHSRLLLPTPLHFPLHGPFPRTNLTAFPYPVGTASRAIRLNIAPNPRRFRWPSAKSSQAIPAWRSGKEHTQSDGTLPPLLAARNCRNLWSAAGVQAESLLTRTVCENVSGLLVENRLRAHDDDPRVPVLVNPHGHERPHFDPGSPARRLTVFSSLLFCLQTSQKQISRNPFA